MKSAMVLVVLLLSTAGGAMAGTLFFDDFESGAAAQWGNERGNWIVSGGAYYATSPGNSPAVYTSLPFILTDFTIEADIYGVADGGIWLRSNYSPETGVSGLLLVTGGYGFGGNAIHIDVFHNDSWYTTVPHYPGLFSLGDNIHLSVDVRGDTYTAYVNGSSTPAASISLADFDTGQVGLYLYGTQRFDNVRITVVPEPSAMLAVLAALGGGVGALVVRRGK